ncbi:hypothetical protein AGABI1DRAFT_129957 [Agaricus bisporus var. burnettii JB137-S8]|uniref:Uncharacterized protein n=1 Tax=Agaricus bisporus var. burnettii (strain JB137-S8 / ATCC MYA-4627 / FGSC 10392) TaxID=597362 RepID=K5X432_AGABU|nr:uncharacterized protein AGABI1DRAFT_129957 [Agaricus bisporus var. burnettii JB137-S8]EKM77672.1 hypothetical protein AGABI1DRAFT_129957 [Agaricus bisporus var. burnettii JB137-S8]
MAEKGGGYWERGQAGRMEPIGSPVQAVWEDDLSNVGSRGAENVEAQPTQTLSKDFDDVPPYATSKHISSSSSDYGLSFYNHSSPAFSSNATSSYTISKLESLLYYTGLSGPGTVTIVSNLSTENLVTNLPY